MRSILMFLLTILHVWGDNGYFDTNCDTSLSRCFKYVSSPATYTDAEEICIEKGGHLVSIQNGFVGAAIGESATHAFSSPNFSYFWIGANFIFNNHWSWTDGTEFSYTNWAPGQPANNVSATMQLKTNFWLTADPTTLKPFVCEIAMQSSQTPTSPSCPKTFQCELGWTPYNEYCYKPFFNSTFDDAEARCQEHDAHLVSIHSDKENFFVSDISKRGQTAHQETDFTWIGLHRPNGPWVWTDGTKINYTIWGTGVPANGNDYHCAALVADGWYDEIEWNSREWTNWTCDIPQRNFVCKKPA